MHALKSYSYFFTLWYSSGSMGASITC